MIADAAYRGATRHPWPCLLFVLPLLASYESLVLAMGGTHPDTVRNGADNWLRMALNSGGINQFWLPPLLLACVFAVWAKMRWADRPGDLTGTLSGMALESVAYALGLWAISRLLPSLLQRWGVALTLATETNRADAASAGLARLVSFLGAGIYEEAIFRLAIYSGLFLALTKMAGQHYVVAGMVAGMGSAALFSAAHHIGPYGQPYSNYVFLFRLAAGLYFAALYQLRGFGIAVGTHACYNVMIGVGTA